MLQVARYSSKDKLPKDNNDQIMASSVSLKKQPNQRSENSQVFQKDAANTFRKKKQAPQRPSVSLLFCFVSSTVVLFFSSFLFICLHMKIITQK